MEGTKQYLEEMLLMFTEDLLKRYFLVTKREDIKKFPTAEHLVGDFIEKTFH